MIRMAMSPTILAISNTTTLRDSDNAAKRERQGVEPVVRDLALISVGACVALAIAWSYEADLFAIFFATSAAVAIVEAVRRSV